MADPFSGGDNFFKDNADDDSLNFDEADFGKAPTGRDGAADILNALNDSDNLPNDD